MMLRRSLLMTGALFAGPVLLVTACGPGDEATAPSTTAGPAGTAPVTASPGTPGTSGTTPGTVAPAVRTAVDRLCGRIDDVTAALGGIDGVGGLAPALDRLADAMEGVEEDLDTVMEATEEPRRRQVQEVVDAVEAGTAKLGDAPGAALEGDGDRAVRLVEEAGDDFSRARRGAADLGGDRCSVDSPGTTGTTTA